MAVFDKPEEKEIDNKKRTLRNKVRSTFYDDNDEFLADDELYGRRKYTLADRLEEGDSLPFFCDLKGCEVTLAHFQKTGFVRPILVRDKIGLGMRMPSENFTVSDVKKCVGSYRTVDVMDVTTQKDLEMSMKDWTSYYEGNDDGSGGGKRKNERLLNVISLEFSHTKLENYVDQPSVVRDLDWVDLAWPPFYRQVQASLVGPSQAKTMWYPKVQKYCLMSVAGCYTDFHIDMGGTSVWYHILKGRKIFWFIEPTEENLKTYEEWTLTAKQGDIFFADLVDQYYKITLTAGNTFFIPSGWIHAVYTPVDSLVFGGNFLHAFNISMQLRIWQLEVKTHVPPKFRYPFYIELHWYVLERYVSNICNRDHRISAQISDVAEQQISESNEAPVPGVNISNDEDLSSLTTNTTTAMIGIDSEMVVEDMGFKSLGIVVVSKESFIFKAKSGLFLTDFEVVGLEEIVRWLSRLPGNKRNVPRDIPDAWLLIEDVKRLLKIEELVTNTKRAVTGTPLLKNKSGNERTITKRKYNASSSSSTTSSSKFPKSNWSTFKAAATNNKKLRRSLLAVDSQSFCGSAAGGGANRPVGAAIFGSVWTYRRVRCRACEPCLRKDCLECWACKDMKKYGGSGTLKKPCLSRQCLQPLLPKTAVCLLCGSATPPSKVEPTIITTPSAATTNDQGTVNRVEEDATIKTEKDGKLTVESDEKGTESGKKLTASWQRLKEDTSSGKINVISTVKSTTTTDSLTNTTTLTNINTPTNLFPPSPHSPLLPTRNISTPSTQSKTNDPLPSPCYSVLSSYLESLLDILSKRLDSPSVITGDSLMECTVCFKVVHPSCLVRKLMTKMEGEEAGILGRAGINGTIIERYIRYLDGIRKGNGTSVAGIFKDGGKYQDGICEDSGTFVDRLEDDRTVKNGRPSGSLDERLVRMEGKDYKNSFSEIPDGSSMVETIAGNTVHQTGKDFKNISSEIPDGLLIDTTTTITIPGNNLLDETSDSPSIPILEKNQSLLPSDTILHPVTTTVNIIANQLTNSFCDDCPPILDPIFLIVSLPQQPSRVDNNNDNDDDDNNKCEDGNLKMVEGEGKLYSVEEEGEKGEMEEMGVKLKDLLGNVDEDFPGSWECSGCCLAGKRGLGRTRFRPLINESSYGKRRSRKLPTAPTTTTTTTTLSSTSSVNGEDGDKIKRKMAAVDKQNGHKKNKKIRSDSEVGRVDIDEMGVDNEQGEEMEEGGNFNPSLYGNKKEREKSKRKKSGKKPVIIKDREMISLDHPTNIIQNGDRLHHFKNEQERLKTDYDNNKNNKKNNNKYNNKPILSLTVRLSPMADDIERREWRKVISPKIETNRRREKPGKFPSSKGTINSPPHPLFPSSLFPPLPPHHATATTIKLDDELLNHSCDDDGSGSKPVSTTAAVERLDFSLADRFLKGSGGGEGEECVKDGSNGSVSSTPRLNSRGRMISVPRRYLN